MANLLSIATALPNHRASHSDVLGAASEWLKNDEGALNVFTRFLESVRINQRRFVMSPQEIVSLSSGLKRAEIFEREAPILGIAAARGALELSGVAPKEVDALIFTSCSCPIIPSIDTLIVEKLGLRSDVLRTPLYQAGCAGGITGLALANQLCSSLRNVLLVSVELCSLVFQETNHETSNLVGAALFGDGAAAAVVSKRPIGKLKIIGQNSKLLPGTRHLMGYDLKDTGAHLRLGRELPIYLRDEVPSFVRESLSKSSVTKEEVPWWLFHPGSIKILGVLQEVLELRPEQAPWAEKVLWNVGNMSSATILFVMNEFLSDSKPSRGENVAVIGVGPGLTLEGIVATLL